MARYRCKRCNYAFNVETGRHPRLCQNCGSENSVGREQTADELLTDLDD